jgi:tetratricopeptide (TPR) repeat protein
MAHLIEAHTWRDRARAANERGDRAGELTALRQAVAHLALAEPEEEPDARRDHADASRRLADILADSGDWPEAMQAYQEATDAYGSIPGMDSAAGECARRIRDGVRALRQRPEDRLYLLTARYERELRNLAVQPGTDKEQGDCVFHIAAILHRRQRYREAIERFAEALALYEKSDGTESERARTAMRMGDIYFGPLEDEVRAFTQYRRAEHFFSRAEELEEPDWMARQECARRLRELATDLSDLSDIAG